MTVLNALATAGGFRDFARVQHIYVLRPMADGSRKRLHFDYKSVVGGKNLNQDIELQTGDAYFLFGPTVDLRREGRRVSLSLDYQPHIRIYRNTPELNIIDQGLGFGAAYRASSHLAFHAGTTLSYSNGFSQLSQNAESSSGIGTSAGQSPTLYTSTLRHLMLGFGVDGAYQASARDSISIFLGQSTLNFQHQIPNTANLQNTMDRDAGLEYRHRLSPHTTVGIDYRFQNIQFGPVSRALVQSALVSYDKQFAPSLSVHAFGGPQYSQQDGSVLKSPAPSMTTVSSSSKRWNWAAGGAITKRTDNIVVQLTAQHQVGNGGGLGTASVSSSVGANVRHRLAGSWDAIWAGGYANNTSLMPDFTREGYRSFTAGVGLRRPLRERLNLGLRYDFVRQLTKGNSQFFGSFDRDLCSVEFTYRFREIALGR